MAGNKDELTKAVLLWVYDIALADVVPEPHKVERARKTAFSELERLKLIDEIGNPTKEGRRLLGLV